MERSAAGGVDRLEVLEAEDRADAIALELLAPRQAVLQRLELREIPLRDDAAFRTATKILEDDFGLPSEIAEQYGRTLVLNRRSTRSFREWLSI
jgi:hypothetical protein